MSTELPASFVGQMSEILSPQEHPAFLKSLGGISPVSIQLHPSKYSPLTKETKYIPWYPKGRYLPKRPIFTLDPNFHAGGYYVQEASSMFIAQLAQYGLPSDRPWKILDLCAAPGGKSCLLASVAPKGSLLISNEVIKGRYGILKYNLAKWGIDNCWTTNHDPKKFAALTGFFDLVVVDAPCSGEGMFRKDSAAIKEWSLDHVNLCAARQERILRAAAPLVAQGGLLIYATCTYNKKENEAQARFLQQSGAFDIIQPHFPPNWQITTDDIGYRFYPHKTKGEGFFTFAARKLTNDAPNKRKGKVPGHWTRLPERATTLPALLLREPKHYQFYQDKAGLIHAINRNWHDEMCTLVAALGRLDMGFPVGTIKGKQIIPAAELALHKQLSPTTASIEVDRLTALKLLKKETPIIENLPKGWQLITHQNNGLLWVKGLGHRYNNYYPSAWRIRMEVE